MTRITRLSAGLFAAALLFAGLNAGATLVGPYTADPNTLHLWHLDESATPAADSATSGGTNLVGLLNGATLGNASFTGFGNALNTLDLGQNDITNPGRDALLTPSTAIPPGNIQFTYANSTNGAFTYEAIVWIGFDPAKNLGPTANGGNNRGTPCHILTCESGANASRIFQFRLFPKGNTLISGGTGTVLAINGPFLTFENVRAGSANQPTIYAPIPITGPDAIVSNQWYHVAVTYNGVPNTSGNIKFYWTLLDPSRLYANEVPITSVQPTLSGPNPLSSAAAAPVIGNQARATISANFLGFIDEVRMSGVGRKSTEMMFYSTNPVVVTPPASQTVALGDPASFSVLSAGLPTLLYQWRHAGTNIPGATLDAYSIASAQTTNAGDYDVVITNNYNSTTSTVATLTVRLPLDLTWIGSAGAIWNTNLVNWDTNADASADTVFTARDNVTFNANGSGAPVVLITNLLSPRSITVNASNDYRLTSTNGGGIAGASSLVKSGTGTLIVDTDNSFTGPTTIQTGILQVGNGTNRGSLGNGPITNNSALVVYRTGNFNVTDILTGSGSLTNNATNSITISGTNTLSGPVTLNAGALTLTGPQAKGNSTEFVLNATANASGPTRLTLGGGITFGAAITLSVVGTSASPDNRCSLTTSDSTNVLNCGIVLGGDGSIQVSSDGAAATSLFQVTTPAINSPSFVGKLIFRGNGNGNVTSQINIGGQVSKTDGGLWTITSTGNAWTITDVANGTLRMGAVGVLPSNITLNVTFASAVLDLAGYNQTVDTLTGPGIIGNSSTTADSTLTVHPSGLSLFSGVIRDSVAGGTRKVGLTVASGTLTLSGTNSYTGDTTINAGSLELLSGGLIPNTAVINIASGATLDASLRTDGTLTVNPGQTLKGDGAFNVAGSLVNAGTIELKLNKFGATLTNDSINGASSITFGGTLKLDITASPALTTSDSFKLFNVGGGGAFTDIIPGPGFGLAWDISTLATDGILRIATSTVPSTGTNINVVVTGNQMELSWPSDYIGWRLQAQTNSVNVGITTNWFNVPGSSTTNQVFMPINPANGSVFYRMIYP